MLIYVNYSSQTSLLPCNRRHGRSECKAIAHTPVIECGRGIAIAVLPHRPRRRRLERACSVVVITRTHGVGWIKHDNSSEELDRVDCVCHTAMHRSKRRRRNRPWRLVCFGSKTIGQDSCLRPCALYVIALGQNAGGLLGSSSSLRRRPRIRVASIRKSISFVSRALMI